MVFGSIRKFTENTLARGAANYIKNNPKAYCEMAQHFQKAVFDPRPFELETADEVCEALLDSLLTCAKSTPDETDVWRHKLIGWGDQFKKEGNKCGMYAYNIAAAAYSSSLDAAKMKSGAVERCNVFCAMITTGIMTKRNIDKLTGGTDVEASRDHIEGFQEAKDPDEYVPTVVECPKCTTKCQVTSGKQDTIRCPKCSNAFEVKT